MSIMDHDPKYAKLREWRRTSYRGWLIGEYRWHVEMCMRPPAPLIRQIQRIQEEQPGILFTNDYPMLRALPRQNWTKYNPWHTIINQS